MSESMRRIRNFFFRFSSSSSSSIFFLLSSCLLMANALIRSTLVPIFFFLSYRSIL